MKVTFIQPTIGRIRDSKLERPWALEPLAIGVLAGITPTDVDLEFYDDRIESIDYDDSTDLVAISIETLTALRGYEIAGHYKKRGVPTILGGVHATLLPGEVAKYADVVVSGPAERLWPLILSDFRKGKLQKFYRDDNRATFPETRVNRSIFSGKKYFPIHLIEFGRGCPFRCDFCDIPVYFDGQYTTRSLDGLVAEIKAAEQKLLVVVDDNLGARPQALRDFCRAITPLGVKWVSQTSITIARNESLLDEIAESGCLGFLIGFESLNSANLMLMNKKFNTCISFKEAIHRFHERGMGIYGSFIVGYDHDTAASVEELVDFAIDQKLLIANFYPLTPIPGTPLYKRLREEGRMLNERWWLDYEYRYGDFVFRPARMDPKEMATVCEAAKATFYSYGNILRRAWKSELVDNNLTKMVRHLGINAMTRKEIRLKGETNLGYDRSLTHLLQ